MTTPEQECLRKAVLRGSANYYSLLKLDPLQKICVSAIFAFYQEINEIIFTCHDPIVAEAKFNWWRLEVSQLVQGQPTHPIMKVLQRGLKHFNLSPQTFADLIDGVEDNLRVMPFKNFGDVTIHIMRTTGTRELLIAQVLGLDKLISIETIHQFALSLELVEQIQYLHRDVQQGLIFFPEDEMEKFQITVSILQQFKTTKEIRDFLFEQAEKAKLSFSKFFAGLPKQKNFSYANLMIRAEISLAILREIEASRFEVLENLISLTPLRCWWIGFKVWSNS